MKTRVAFGLAVCCLVSVLIGSVISSTVQAQYRMSPDMPLTFVQFTEDPLMHHGRQIESYVAAVDSATNTTLITVPSGKLFVLTDIHISPSHENDTNHFTISTETESKIKGWFQDSWGNSISLNSGIVFKENELIRSKLAYAVTNATLTISGYYVDI